MKTIKEIDLEIAELVKSAEKEEYKKRLRISSKVAFLRQCKLYLESDPRLEFIQQQKDETLKKMKSIESNFDAWKVGRCLSTYKDTYAAYLSQMGMDNLKSQLRTLNYLLD